MRQADLEPESASRPEPGHVARIRGRLVVLGVFALIAAAYLASVPGVWSIHADSACYLVAGRSLARGEGYTFNYEPLGKYPPVYPLLLAAIYGTLGDNIWAMQALGALAGVGAMAFAYLLVKARAGRWPALAVVGLTATCTWFWAHSAAYILSGVPYTLFAMMTLWLAERQAGSARLSVAKWLLVVGLAAVAMYTHLSGVALVPALVAGAVLARGQKWPLRQRLVAAALVGLVGAGAAELWVSRTLDESTGPGYTNLLEKEPREMLQDPFPKLRLRASEWAATPLSQDPEDFPWLLGLALEATLLAPGLVLAFRRYRSAPELYVCCYFLVTFFHGGMGGKERYVLGVVPLLFYYAYLSLKVLGGWATRALGARGRAALGGRLGWVPRAAMALPLVVVMGQALYSRHRCRSGATAFAESTQDLQLRRTGEWEAAVQALDRVAPKDARLFPSPRGDDALIHFFTGRHVGKLSVHARGMDILRGMAAQHADFVFAYKHPKAFRGLISAISPFPDCFPLLYPSRRIRIYGIDKERLGEILAGAVPPKEWDPETDPWWPAPEADEDDDRQAGAPDQPDGGSH